MNDSKNYLNHISAILSVCLSLAGITSSGATCIASGNTQGLVAALTAAEDADAPAVIKLEQGTYSPTTVDVTIRAGIRLVGGYVPTAAHTCSERNTDASKTRIAFYEFSIESNSLEYVEGMTLGPQSANSPGAYLGIGGFDRNNIEMRNVRVVNLAYDGFITEVGIGFPLASSTDIKLTNVQFDNLMATNGPDFCAATLSLAGDAHAVINHATADLAGGNLCISDGNSTGTKHISIWNSIIWDSTNSGRTIKTIHHPHHSGIFVELNDVDYIGAAISPDDHLVFNPLFLSIQSDPQWTNPAAGDYSIFNSVATNAGTVNAPGGEPPTDIVGADRKIGTKPDMGAQESPFDDNGNIFTVTNTNDVTDVNSPQYLGSLRWALDRANSGAGAALINFALPNCPNTVKLNSPLPTIWVPLMIDGYSEAASSPNTDPGSLFNGHLCVVVEPASSLVTPAALIVPAAAQDASLTVQGLWFGGFSQGIELFGGSSHQIVGNIFGGLVSGFQIYGFEIAGVHVETSAPLIIGGANPGDRNVFLNANSGGAGSAAGVLVGALANNSQRGCQIIDNLFGVSPDGASADPNNENGILIQGSGCMVIGNYLAGNIQDAIRLVGGSHNVVQNNIIGPSLTFGQDFYNPGAGIRITNNANDNVIGTGEGFYLPAYSYQNVITDMDAGGVIVSNSTGNSIRGNAIYHNGLANGLNVDLGGDGPTPNDPDDTDGGVNSANDLMNYPIPDAIVWTTGEPPQPGSVSLAVRGFVDVPPGSYQIDAYYDLGCSSTGRGGGTWVGEAVYTAFFTGAGAFEVPVYIPFFSFDSTDGRISLTATSTAGHSSTSEFSRCMSVDTIFSDGFDR